MLLGIYVTQSFLVREHSQKMSIRLALFLFCFMVSSLFYYELIHFRLFTTINSQLGVALPAFSTVVGVIFRVGIMTILNYALLRYPPPVGYALPEEAITTMLPLIGFFNATLALYTIPLGHFISKVISTNIKIT
jgi:hypothetical protein